MASVYYQPTAIPKSSLPLSSMSQFAFADVKGDICLVQVSTPSPGAMSSALMVSDIRIFRHEFITIFRYSHSATVHPSDIHVLEPLDEQCTMYEEENGTVFLARDVMDRLQKLIARSKPAVRRYPIARPTRMHMARVHGLRA